MGAGTGPKTRSVEGEGSGNLPVLPRASAVPPVRVVTQRAPTAPARTTPAPAFRDPAATAAAPPVPAPAPKRAAPPPKPALVQRQATPAPPPTASATASARTAKSDLDIDEIVTLVARRLRTEFRLDRERFGRLRDSTR